LACLTVLSPQPLSAQEWNDARTISLIQEARTLRQGNSRDPDFQSYSSQARGYVHFFLDRRDTNERILVKTDQIALAVFWRAPGETRQRIIGLRDEKALPTDIHYHLDHFTVVQDDFGDHIRIGDGDEVEAVLHPVGPGADEFYDFALADSITLSFQGAEEPIRVYEILVRPKDPDLPAFVGSLFLDGASKAIVRMNFTFTPASYVDSYLDRIQISLENGLWNGRYWLPYRQQLEIRREVPWLDIPAGTVIKGWFEVGDYEINTPLPESIFRGPALTTLPEATRRAFPFEDSLHAHLDTEGLRPPPEMAEIRSQAMEIYGQQYLSGLRKSRLYLPSPMISSGLRFNRAEGVFLGGGASFGISPSLATSIHGGFAVGPERPEIQWTLTGGERAPGSGIRAFLHQPRDLGPIQGASGLINSLSSLIFAEDYQDLFFSSGAEAFHTWQEDEGRSWEIRGRWEEHRSARDEVSSDPLAPRFRPVLEVDEGNWLSLEAGMATPTPFRDLTFKARGVLGNFEGEAFGELSGELAFHRKRLSEGLDLEGTLKGGILPGDPPKQALFLLGGRETVPGYPFRSRVGDQYWILKALASKDLLAPWLRMRAFGSAGGTHYGGPSLPDPWLQDTSDSFLLSAGLGLGLGWDILHLDLARGLREGGEWEFIFSVNHSFWDWL
jgi:hypothetical protein